MSSDDNDDFLDYTPLFRSQPATSASKAKKKPSKLSLSFRKQRKTANATIKTETKASTSRPKTSIVNRPKQKTPIKSRADQPEENCDAVELARWKFLFKSEDAEDKKPQPVKRKSEAGEECAQSSWQKKKSCAVNGRDRCARCKCWFDNSHRASHMLTCKTKDLSLLPRCSAGSECSKTVEEHYWKFNHSEEPQGKSNGKTNRTKLKKELSNSSDSDSGYAIRGPTKPKTTPSAAASQKSPDVVVLPCAERPEFFKQESMPLFDLWEKEKHNAQIDQIDRELEGDEDSHESSDLLANLIPDIDLFEEDDKTTVCFEEDNHSTHDEGHDSSTHEGRVDDKQDNDAGSKLLDLRNRETEDEIDDDGDEIIANISEEVINHIAMPAMEKVLKWRDVCTEPQASTSTAESERSKPGQRAQKKVVQPICIHLHYHEASPAPASAPAKERGQKSILSYFKAAGSKDEKCSCGVKEAGSREESVAAWQEIMKRMREKKAIVPLPSVSQSSSQPNTKNSSSSKPNILQASEDTAVRGRWRKASEGAKKCPFYKRIPDTGIVVDAFSYGSIEGATAYFLSHFHYDHYVGLRRDFRHPVYCSEITARLVNLRIGVPMQYLNVLPMWVPQRVCGVEVTLLEANHCPGAVMFLFKVKPGVTHLHVGDFRADPSMESFTALQCPINTLFLDTTYCSPDYAFPTQEKTIERCVSLALDHHCKNDKTLFVVGSYTLGKERVFKAIASVLDCSIWVRNDKRQILNCIKDDEIEARLSDDKKRAKVHVLSMVEVKGERLRNYLSKLRPSFTEIVGICPTGWEFTKTSDDAASCSSSEHPYPDVYVYGVPYSEHSSFNELRRFVQFLKPKRILPTVNNGSDASRKQMQRHFNDWQTTRRLFA